MRAFRSLASSIAVVTVALALQAQSCESGPINLSYSTNVCVSVDNSGDCSHENSAGDATGDDTGSGGLTFSTCDEDKDCAKLVDDCNDATCIDGICAFTNALEYAGNECQPEGEAVGCFVYECTVAFPITGSSRGYCTPVEKIVGADDGYCYIGGECFADGSDDGNECMVCDATASNPDHRVEDAWTAASSATICIAEDSSGNPVVGSCNAGVCEPPPEAGDDDDDDADSGEETDTGEDTDTGDTDTGEETDTGEDTDTGDTDTGEDTDTGDTDTGDTDTGDTDTGDTDTGDTDTGGTTA